MADEMVVAERSYELSPVVSVPALIRRRDDVKNVMDQVMSKDLHYGTIPGTKKPVLLKAGAEMLATTFGLTAKFKQTSMEQDWTGEQHGGETFFSYVTTCELWRGDWMVTSGSGACNSFEKKYRWRKGERTCPKCKKAAIAYSSKNNNFFCSARNGGCGANFAGDDVALTSQAIGDVPNPDICDMQNTILKMSEKRALVQAILLATGASSMFTQDLEDMTGFGYQQDDSGNQPSSTPSRSAASSNGHSTANGSTPAKRQDVDDLQKQYEALLVENGCPKEEINVIGAGILSKHFKSISSNHSGVTPETFAKMRMNADNFKVLIAGLTEINSRIKSAKPA